jgi:hypothetical protein
MLSLSCVPHCTVFESQICDNGPTGDVIQQLYYADNSQAAALAVNGLFTLNPENAAEIATALPGSHTTHHLYHAATISYPKAHNNAAYNTNTYANRSQFVGSILNDGSILYRGVNVEESKEFNPSSINSGSVMLPSSAIMHEQRRQEQEQKQKEKQASNEVRCTTSQVHHYSPVLLEVPSRAYTHETSLAAHANAHAHSNAVISSNSIVLTNEPKSVIKSSAAVASSSSSSSSSSSVVVKSAITQGVLESGNPPYHVDMSSQVERMKRQLETQETNRLFSLLSDRKPSAHQYYQEGEDEATSAHHSLSASRRGNGDIKINSFRPILTISEETQREIEEYNRELEL